MAQNTMPMNNNPEKNKLDLYLKDDDEIPFILCTPVKNENQDTTTYADETGSPKEHKTFFLNPRRSSCQCAGCRGKKVVGPVAIAEMLSEESSLSGMGKGSASANESLDCNNNTLHSSPRSSPVPILQSPFAFDVVVTPRVINLLKKQRASQEEEQHQEEDDDEKSASFTAGPLFPILGRQDNHHLQQQQLRHPVIRRPIPRYRR
jgi:hypothetical protein